MSRRILPALGMSLVLLTLSACSLAATQSPISQAAAEHVACSALVDFGDAVKGLQTLDPATASIDDVKAQAKKVQDSWKDVKTSLQGVTSADLAAIDAAWAGLSKALDNIPSNVPVSTVLSGLKTAVAPVKAAYSQVSNGLGCAQANPIQ